MNDVARLKGFAGKQMSLLQSLDQAQRQPVSVIFECFVLIDCIYSIYHFNSRSRSPF